MDVDTLSPIRSPPPSVVIHCKRYCIIESAAKNTFTKNHLKRSENVAIWGKERMRSERTNDRPTDGTKRKLKVQGRNRGPAQILKSAPWPLEGPTIFLFFIFGSSKTQQPSSQMVGPGVHRNTKQAMASANVWKRQWLAEWFGCTGREPSTYCS